MNLRDHNDWDKANGLLSVKLEPSVDERFVLLNGNTGNFCLDYSIEGDYTHELAVQRAWSSDTGYYLKVLADNNVIVTRWWDGHEEVIRGSKIEENPTLFYQVLTKDGARPIGSVVAFAKEVFLKLRSCILQQDNGQASLRTFMYLLAALEQGVETPSDVNSAFWQLDKLDNGWISSTDWEWIYNGFKKGTINNGVEIKPLVKLVLRHASNRLFQEAHREATKKVFQPALFGGITRKYDSEVFEGAFYTPTPLVRTIVQESLWALNKVKPLSERKNLRILDPACGSAEFLRETLRQLKIRNYNGNIEVVGWDKSEIACEISNFVLNYENVTEWNSAAKIIINNKDSLKDSWGTDLFDIVLMNPPFISFENLGEYKSIVIEKLGKLSKRQPDAAALFWKNASEIVKEAGVLGIVLPFSLLGAETYSELRKYIKDELKINFSLIGRLGSAGLFEKAMIIPSIQIGIKGEININTSLWTNYEQKAAYSAFRDLRIYRLSDIPTPIHKPSYSIYENNLLTDVKDKNNWTVNSFQLNKLEEQLKGFNRVEKLFNVTQGVIAGNNSAFLLSKKQWVDLPRLERNYFRPCIMRDSIKEGQLNDSWFLFYPYGKYKITSEDELKKKLSIYYDEKLRPNKNKLQTRTVKGIEWWELNRPRLDWQLEMKSKLISAYFGKSGYFAFDKDGTYVVGQSFAWLPKRSELDTEEYYFAYLGLLHAPLIDTLLEMVSVNIAGGQFDLSKHYVEKMPLPDLTKSNNEIITNLSRIGKNIYEGMDIDKKDLNQIAANAYGIDLNILK